jgi:hypothetical protein
MNGKLSLRRANYLKFISLETLWLLRFIKFLYPTVTATDQSLDRLNARPIFRSRIDNKNKILLIN